MRLGGFLSFLFHLLIVLLILFGLPDLFKQEEIAAPVAVQLATLADITAQPVPKQTPPTPVVKQETPPPPAPAPPVPPTPPTPPAPQPAEDTPAPPPPEPTPTPPLPVPPAPQVTEQTPPDPIPIPDKQETPPPPDEAKIEPPPAPILRPANLKPSKPQKPVQQAQDFNSLLKNVEKLKTTTPDTEQPPQPDTPPQPNTSSSDLSAPQMTSSEIDAVRSQISGCWYIDPGKKGADDMVVEIHVNLAQDGSVEAANIVDTSRLALDGYYRAAAEAALRAVKKCSPLHMPPRKFDTWKSTTFRFNPGGMLSQ
jgi:outer membrane biosynthesis protein TonB